MKTCLQKEALQLPLLLSAPRSDPPPPPCCNDPAATSVRNCRSACNAPSLRMRSASDTRLGLSPWKVAALRSSSGVTTGSKAICATRWSGRPTVSAKRPLVYSAGDGGGGSVSCAAPLLLLLLLVVLGEAAASLGPAPFLEGAGAALTDAEPGHVKIKLKMTREFNSIRNFFMRCPEVSTLVLLARSAAEGVQAGARSTASSRFVLGTAVQVVTLRGVASLFRVTLLGKEESLGGMPVLSPHGPVCGIKNLCDILSNVQRN